MLEQSFSIVRGCYRGPFPAFLGKFYVFLAFHSAFFPVFQLTPLFMVFLVLSGYLQLFKTAFRFSQFSEKFRFSRFQWIKSVIFRFPCTMHDWLGLSSYTSLSFCVYHLTKTTRKKNHILRMVWPMVYYTCRPCHEHGKVGSSQCQSVFCKTFDRLMD